MTPSTNVYGLFRVMRLLRPALDIVVLLAGISLFIYLHNMPNDRHPLARLTQVSTKQPPIQAMSYVQENHASEEAMWSSFSTWLYASKSTTGSCRFEPSANDEGVIAYHLLCAGNSLVHQRPNKGSKSAPAELPLKHVFVIPKMKPTLPSRNAAPEKTARPETLTPKVVQGWVNTPTGRKHFDPVRQGWIE